MNLSIILKLDFVVCDMPVSVNKVLKNRKRIVSAVYRVYTRTGKHEAKPLCFTGKVTTFTLQILLFFLTNNNCVIYSVQQNRLSLNSIS